VSIRATPDSLCFRREDATMARRASMTPFDSGGAQLPVRSLAVDRPFKPVVEKVGMKR
jgi:hypothetical protein